MEEKTMFQSDISHKKFPLSEKIHARTIRHSILKLIQRDHPKFTHDSSISADELKDYRERALSEYMFREIGELTDPEKKVLTSLTEQKTLSDKIEGQDRPETFGQQVADKVASFGGSWTFIISFAFFLFAWIGLNAFLFFNRGFDPYPFILLNLILSCLAAIQAPVIMMSQNRQEEKDRERAQNDYMINLKAELEIRTLHEKIDHFINDQYLEIREHQKNQSEKLNEILVRLNKERPE
ncbi:MAG: DUF1003 domain-containing protein [Breznakibacter sp.]